MEKLFNEKAMKYLVENDKYLQFMYQDLIKKINDEKRVLSILFNTEILDGNDFDNDYLKACKFIEK